MLDDSLLNPRTSSIKDKWPDDDIGRNSVNPWTIPKIIDSIKLMLTLPCFLLVLYLDSSILIQCHLLKLKITGQSILEKYTEC